MALATLLEYILQAEQVLGFRLPDWLRQRLLKANGGEIYTEDDNWQLYSVLDVRDRKHAIRSATHLVQETHVARALPEFPANAIAIADNGAGDRLILSAEFQTLPEHQAWAWLWAHDGRHPVEAVALQLYA